MLLAALTVVSNLIYVFFSQLVFIFIAVIVTNIGAGGTGGGGQGGGPFNPVEQALLAEKCTPESRDRIFSLNAFAGSILGSLGAAFRGRRGGADLRFQSSRLRSSTRSRGSPASVTARCRS